MTSRRTALLTSSILPLQCFQTSTHFLLILHWTKRILTIGPSSFPGFPRMTKISAMLFTFLREDVTIAKFQTRSPLTHYLLVVCIWSLQLFLWLTTLAVSLMLILSFLILCLAVSLLLIRSILIPCLLLRSSTRLDRLPSPLTTCLPLHSCWFPLILPLLCCPTLWPWLHMLRLLGLSRMLRSLSARSLCRPRVLRPALPRLWPLGSVLAALHRRRLRRAAVTPPPGVHRLQVVLTAIVTLEIFKGPRGKVLCPRSRPSSSSKGV